MIVEQKEVVQVERWIGKKFISYEQPTAIFLAGIHGNEQTGIESLQTVLTEIEKRDIPLHGNIYALRGNLQAIATDQRFIDIDLNRAWTEENLNKLFSDKQHYAETQEVKQLSKIFDELITKSKANILFVDLHTTSSYSPPFTITEDTLRNREIALNLPVTNVLGITEKLEGTISGYYSDKGPVSLVFEAGQHYEQSSVDRHTSAIWLSLVKFGIINKEDIDYNFHYKVLKNAGKGYPKLVETSLRYALQPNDDFTMEKGFSNFSKVEKDQLLAQHNGQSVYAPASELVFMPLYQKKGADGFFLVHEISKFWIGISEFLRKQKLDHIVTVLPGITKDKHKDNTYIVNTHIASFRALDFLHLLGFRKRTENGQFLSVSRLPYDIKGPWG